MLNHHELKFVNPKNARSLGTPDPQFGRRKSCHARMKHCIVNSTDSFQAWAIDATRFCQMLFADYADHEMQLFAISPNGEVLDHEAICPHQAEEFAKLLLDLSPESNNIMFSPVPHDHCGQVDEIRNGWVTIEGADPLSIFPPPVAYWRTGRDCYEAIIARHSQTALEDSCNEAMASASEQAQASLSSDDQDLLIMPGSLVHRPGVAPFTALLEYDVFTATYVKDHAELWTYY